MADQIQNGTWVTMVTPFTDGNQIDYPGVARLVDWYIRKGVDGIFAVCQSSEMFYLSLEERVSLARYVLQCAAGRIPVVVSGHISDAPEEQIAELSAMAQLHPAAVVLVSNRLAAEGASDAVWRRNAQRILDSIPDVPFGIYECPYPYKRLMSPDLLRWCAETGRFLFLKDTCCDLRQLREKLAAVEGTPLKIFNANSATCLESLGMGCAGFCGVMLNFHPELYGWLCRNWERDREKAAAMQSFATVASLIELQMYPVNAKYHLQLTGLDIGLTTRAKPFAEFRELQKREVKAVYDLWNCFRESVLPAGFSEAEGSRNWNT